MKGRKQKISKDTCLQNSRAEPEGYAGGQTFIWITENNLTNTDKPEYGLLEQILSPTNLNRAYKRVRSNKGSGGIDKMEVESLKDYLVNNKEKLIQSILDGKYRPNPVRRVEIPKEKGRENSVSPRWWTVSSNRPSLRSYHLFTRNSSHRTVTGSDPGVMHIRH